MKKLFARLRGKAGETLIETLAAILIFTLSSIMLLSMISSASKINQAAKDADARNQTQMEYAEKGADAVDGTPGTVSFRLENGTLLATVNVNIYRMPGDSDAFYSYSKRVS